MSAHARVGSGEEAVDLDRWVELGTDALEHDPSPTGSGLSSADHGYGSLRDKLLAVLAEEEGSLVPPSAGDMTQSEWDSLTEIEREGFRRLQLKQLDPRVVPRYTMGTSRAGSRSTRVYR